MARIVAVTGACGFIGRVVTEALLARGDYVYAIDSLTYAADPTLVETWLHNYTSERFHFTALPIEQLGHFPAVDAVINLAADTHVCNSIQDSTRFMQTNLFGIWHLLEMVRAMRAYETPRFIQISTDEVYGDIQHGASHEHDPLAPSSPYAASKAAADHLVQAWGRTYGVPYNIIRPSNCYGPHQYPEKLIPKAVRWLLLGRPVPVHGDGTQTRSWLHVEDCARAILAVLDGAPANEIYNIGGDTEASVLSIVNAIAEALGKPLDAKCGYTRAGIDRRYQSDDSKLRALGWEPQGSLWRDLPGIVGLERQAFRW